MNQDRWKRFDLYQKALNLLFIINLVFAIIEKKLSKPMIPPEVIGYSFWLSLGLYLGFNLCKYEFSRVFKKNSGQSKSQNFDIE
jgi:hypothetical protein